MGLYEDPLVFVDDPARILETLICMKRKEPMIWKCSWETEEP